jgi:transcriptional regulator with XRE-family HTH domain
MGNFANILTRSGKSMSQVSRETGLSLSHISKMASGTRRPGVEAAILLSRALGVGVEDMLRAFDFGVEVDDGQKAA